MEMKYILKIGKSIIKIEHYKISKLLNISSVSKFLTRKWIEKKGLPSGQYSVNKNIRFKTSVSWSDLCDYSDTYIVVKGTLTDEEDNDDKKRNKKLTF